MYKRQGHDIGKYGCKKSEEKRVPYLHYYYTDLCFNRFDMPMTGHIAANHSTWDLELDNLSVESLLLIYADFRVKSSRSEGGSEVVHFYDLELVSYTHLYELGMADNRLKDLIANVSHDLKTPLTMVRSYAEMIRDLSGDNPVTVSYTHLDVYKRQVLPRPCI